MLTTKEMNAALEDKISSIHAGIFEVFEKAIDNYWLVAFDPHQTIYPYDSTLTEMFGDKAVIRYNPNTLVFGRDDESYDALRLSSLSKKPAVIPVAVVALEAVLHDLQQRHEECKLLEELESAESALALLRAQ
jgi:hypothetical protein